MTDAINMVSISKIITGNDKRVKVNVCSFDSVKRRDFGNELKNGKL